jgi:hypothetical protein
MLFPPLMDSPWMSLLLMVGSMRYGVVFVCITNLIFMCLGYLVNMITTICHCHFVILISVYDNCSLLVLKFLLVEISCLPSMFLCFAE